MGRKQLAGAVALLCAAACGSRTQLSAPTKSDAGPAAHAGESCNGLDDDGDGKVDETFRDAQGNYVGAAHCGACGHACDQPIPNAAEIGCELLGGAPTCVAKSCKRGFDRSRSGACASLDDHLCLSCRDQGDCGTLQAARCLDIAGQPHCTRTCGDGCPAGYVCVRGDHCEPAAGSCECSAGAADFALACRLTGPGGDCPGRASCTSGTQSQCMPPAEICDGQDDDCDVKSDEGFVDGIGSYSLDSANCGACGID